MIFRHKIVVAVLNFTSLILLSQFNNCVTAKHGTSMIISKISYSSSGGRSGNYENLEITQDSLFYVQAHRGDEKTLKEKTAKEFWDQLNGSINLKDIDKVRSNPGHALYDGIDITIAIETRKEKHAIVNGNEDTLNFKKIRPFTDLLEKKLEELRRRIVW
jgi:hypothetical protein